MAKFVTSYSFNNAEISKENDIYYLTEINKDDSQTFNLSAILDKLTETGGLSIAIKQTGDFAPEGDELVEI